MRTTVTLDHDTDAIVRAIMRDQGISFKEAINQAIRNAAVPRHRAAVRVPTRRMGAPRVDLDHALALLGELDAEHMLRKMRARK